VNKISRRAGDNQHEHHRNGKDDMTQVTLHDVRIRNGKANAIMNTNST
jgi:hypothetical protein